MQRKTIIIIVVSVVAFILITIAAVLIFVEIRAKKTTQPSAVTSSTVASTISPSTTTSAFAEPVAGFKSRVTKKPFGIYITPQNSPISPERFSGYHTGADAEYEDITTDVPVYAIADGEVVLSQIASGYGGVFMINFTLDDTQHAALYGHIRPSSLPPVGKKFKKGDQLGVLGTGYSTETDNERRHLHFAVLSDNRTNIKGYVQNKNDLDGWLDPLTVL